MEKYTRVNPKTGIKETAVLYSSYEAGWSTWNDPNFAIDKRIVQYVLDNATLVKDKYEDNLYSCEDITVDEMKNFLKDIGIDAYCGGVRNLHLIWLPVGTVFRINEYDGSESIEFFDINDYYTA